MKKNLWIVLTVSFCLGLGFVAHAEKAPPISNLVPSAFFPENTYSFSPVVEGTEVTHDFKLINKGNGPLTIEKVKTG